MVLSYLYFLFFILILLALYVFYFSIKGKDLKIKNTIIKHENLPFVYLGVLIVGILIAILTIIFL